MPIRKVLIANRGEIALRIMRTCRDMGVATVAVYSEADRLLPFVAYADEAVLLGPAASSESYLRVDKIIAAARKTGADAIHPGYGFLSEKRELAEACTAAGIAFIGPSAHSIDVMGNKISAKDAVRGFGVELVPGSAGAVADPAEALEIAKKIGFPVLVKAAAGGGGDQPQPRQVDRTAGAGRQRMAQAPQQQLPAHKQQPIAGRHHQHRQQPQRPAHQRQLLADLAPAHQQSQQAIDQQAPGQQDQGLQGVKRSLVAATMHMRARISPSLTWAMLELP